jgi:sialic acid synthase SpsE/spore coat polysaccharide biosynthesis protein SpsF (cytidylyltransferase family)
VRPAIPVLKPSMSQEVKKTYILAEMASSHEGDPEIAGFILESASKAKAEGILFQIFDLETNILPSDEDYNDLKSIYMGQGVWSSLINRAKTLGIEVWANVYDLKSFEFLKNKEIRGYKLHSSNLENRDLLREVALSKKDLLLSIGGLDEEEIKEIIDFVYSFNNQAKIYLMYGLQNFPTKPEDVNLNFISSLSEKFKLPFGYQDHSEPDSPASIYLPVLAQSLGAKIIEKHLTHNRNLKGQDYEAALNPDEFSLFVKSLKSTDNILSKDVNEISSGEIRYKEYKSLMKIVAKKDISAGDILTKDNLSVMRSKKGQIMGRYLDLLIGKVVGQDYKALEPLRMNELIKVGLFITARLKSYRLPMKAIKPILGKPMIEWMIQRLKKANIHPLVLMTSTNPQDDPLVEIAKKEEIQFFRGSEQDVLVRIRDCAREFGVDLIISVTADDPLKEPLFIRKMIDRYLETRFDFCEIKGLPDGCECYAVSRWGVERVCEIKADSDTEIWGPYFRESKELKCDIIEIKDPSIYRPDYRITVDTPEDFEVVNKIFEELLKEKDYFNVYDICKFLDENPESREINSKIVPVKIPTPNFKHIDK